MKAMNCVNLGYQRLLTFECPNGGFDWSGQEPGKPILTAYGLMEFADMANVHYVDPAMIKRTQDWLATKQQQDGSWPPDCSDLFGKLNNTLQSTAYAVWALSHSGYSGSSVIGAGKGYIKDKVASINDNYTLALCANAFIESNSRDTTGFAIIDRLEAAKIVEGDQVHWTSTGEESVTYSRGRYLDLETTAMVTYALLKAGRYPNTVEKAINFIIRQKDAFGLWGQIEATVLSLRVLIMAMDDQLEEIEAEIIMTINGQVLDKTNRPNLKINPVDSSVLRIIDLKPYTIEGNNTVSLDFIGDGNFLYQITGTYYLPWNQVNLPPTPHLKIEVSYDRTNLSVDDTINCKVKVTNTVVGSTTRLGMVDLGIPPGFRVFFEDFDKALADKKIFKYESTNRQLSLYLLPLPYNQPMVINYRLQAKYPLRVSTPASKAYEYYNPQIKDESKPVVLTVN